ncbi:MAG: DUF1573 domain-containing protein [Fimbriimonadales bacterium]|nr:DUF1573 domain-containing protein [Fimbriimonadales bacterium]
MLIGLGYGWLLLLGYAERSLEGRRLYLLGATHDAGRVMQGTAVEHRVWVFNPTLQGLEVDAIPSCGCTVVDGVQRQLSPLSGFVLTVRVETAGKSAGQHTETIDLVVRDGHHSWRERFVVRYEVARASLSQ